MTTTPKVGYAATRNCYPVTVNGYPAAGAAYPISSSSSSPYPPQKKNYGNPPPPSANCYPTASGYPQAGYPPTRLYKYPPPWVPPICYRHPQKPKKSEMGGLGHGLGSE
ncbi:hypothetical protein AMTRI_Chr13g124470 [Amborella trichopoda]